MRNFKKVLLLLSISTVLFLPSLSSVFAAEISNTGFSAGCILSPGENKTVPLFIQNNDSGVHNYQMTAGGAANSYEVYFASDGAPTKTITVQPGANAEIDLNISLKGNASTNADKLYVKAIREDGKENNINLSVLINKDYALSVSSMQNKIDILNGKTAEVTFSVLNNGSKELKSVKLEPDLPYKWIASQGSDTGISLKPGETGTLKMTVEVPSSQVAGNFSAKFKAVSDETNSDQISIPVIVKTSSNIAYWMIGALLFIAGFTLIQFKRHGRR